MNNQVMVFIAAFSILACGCTKSIAEPGRNRTYEVRSLDNGNDKSKWKTITDEQWRKRLPVDQYRVTREKGTERAFTGKYWDKHDAGIYKCADCGRELFSSTTKFDSGTGWPSFYQPVEGSSIGVEIDKSMGVERLEVTCTDCGAHL
ncbi:MAG: peptide-methionine (R)-S-oxide reductase MsrB, partial [Candidatus Obscuribacterales bacterium]|nr:peptide-methionine (R)-S-oxide reductase MsrB [Candidatus Obscuribacterales bacterium]